MAFFSISQIEQAASVRYLDSVRSRYIAESGVIYAEQILKLDKQNTILDSLEDLTFTYFKGQDTDLDNDSKPDSRWFDFKDSEGNLFGRFSVKVSDEASKVNVNVCQREVLQRLFSKLRIDSSKIDILLSRRPLNAIEELGSILEKRDFNLVKDFLTIYSSEHEIDLKKRRRVYLNSAYQNVLLEAFLNRGIKDPYQKVANLKDAQDLDLMQTILEKFYLDNIVPSALSEAGGWQKVGNYYQAQGSNDSGKFIFSNIPVEDGEYYCFLYGPEDEDTVGEVFLDKEELREPILSGEGLSEKIKVNAGAFTINIKPANDKISRFSHVELVNLNPKNGLNRKIITGTEALVINELMVKPAREISIDPVQIDSGQSFQYTFTKITPGYYHMVVLAESKGGFVGDISINGRFSKNNLSDGNYLPKTVYVDRNGSIIVSIKNNSLRQASFKGIRILQQPDAEFIEILNLSPQEFDLSNFSFEVYSPDGELVSGWPATIPLKTNIKPYQHLVFTVDNNDSAPTPWQLRNNGISFRNIWGFDVVGLVFYGDENIDKTFDLLPDNGAKVLLKDISGAVIDAVEYHSSQVKDFISLERPDPTAKICSKPNGIFDGWYPSIGKEGATPNLANENTGMYTQDEETGKLVKHAPSELIVFNRPLSNLSEVIELSRGENWKKFNTYDVARMVDHFSYEATNLALSGHYQSGEFTERNGVFESLHKSDTGVWEFSRIPAGSYLLSILSEIPQTQGEEIQVGIKPLDLQEVMNFSQLLFTQGIACYGIVSFSDNPSAFQIKIINNSEHEIAIKAIILEPVSSVVGRINVNTAPLEVLSSLFDSDDLAREVLKNRPIGIKDNRRLGVGELFLIDPKFIPFHNSLTTSSDTYEILSRGGFNPTGKTQAFQNIRTVVERGQ